VPPPEPSAAAAAGLLLDLGEPSLPGQLDDGQGAVTGEVFWVPFFLMLVVYRFIRL
jgi:hypothetical protein